MRRRAIDRRLDAITVEEWQEIWEAGAYFGVDETFFDSSQIPQMRDAVRAALSRDRTSPAGPEVPDVVNLLNGADDGDEE